MDHQDEFSHHYSAMTPEFDEHLCVCEHGPTVHDDGFGCTEPDCMCMAQWSWTVV